MKRLIVGFSAIILFFSGCAPSVYTLPDHEKDGLVQDEFNHSYETVYKSALNRLSDKNWAIENSDKESGIITTGWRQNSSAAQILVGAARVKATVNIREVTEDATRVIMNVQLQKQNYGSWAQTKVTKGFAEKQIKPFFIAIEEDLN